MEDNNQVIIDIGLDALIASLRDLQKQYEANTAAMKALRDEGKQDSDEYIQLTQANKVLRQEMNGVEKSIQNNIKAEKAQEGSLVQLRAQLANLNKQYDSMSGFERMGTAGEALREKIKALSDNISNLEANTGRYQRNVGNYKSALEGLSGSFKMAGLSTAGLDKSLKLLGANPIMLFFTAIVSAVKSLSSAFKNNEENLDRWKLVIAPINRILELASNAMQQFASKILNVVEAGKSFLSWVGTMLERVPRLGNRIKEMNEEMRDSIALEKEAQAIRNERRKEDVEQAKASLESQRLLTKAYDKANYSAKERLDFLRQATKIEQDRAVAAEQLAKRELELARQRASISKNDSKTNDELAAKEAAYYQALQQREALQTSLKRRESQLLSQIASEEKEVINNVKELRKEIELIKALSIDELIEANKKKNKELAESIQQVVDRVGLLEETFEKLPSAEEMFGDFTEVTDENLKDTTTSFELFAEAFKNNAETIEQTASALSSSFGSVASIYETMAKDESKSEAEREKAARKAKTWAGLQIAANSGTALAKGIAGAMDAPTVAGKIAALASIMAAVLSAIAQAKALAAESHEQGGVIGNKFVGATRGGDDVLTTARRGEMMLNAEQQRRLFDIANGNSQTSLAESLFAAIQAMPAPVMVYSEYNDFKSRVATFNETTKLK